MKTVYYTRQDRSWHLCVVSNIGYSQALYVAVMGYPGFFVLLELHNCYTSISTFLIGAFRWSYTVRKGEECCNRSNRRWSSRNCIIVNVLWWSSLFAWNWCYEVSERVVKICYLVLIHSNVIFSWTVFTDKKYVWLYPNFIMPFAI